MAADYSQTVLRLLLLTLLLIRQYVSSAPILALSQSKMEHGCSHKSDETLCWTAQLQKPLHYKAKTGNLFYNNSTGDSPSLLSPPLNLNEDALDPKHQRNNNNEQEMQKMLVYEEIAKLVAQDAGLVLLGKVGEFYDHFILCHPHGLQEEDEFPSRMNAFQDFHKVHSKLLKEDNQAFSQVKKRVEVTLQQHHDVAWFSMERVHSRQKRSIILNDPDFSKQWHLVNTLEKGMDINVTGVWEQGITGKGVTVAVVDDGLEWTNPDLHTNYNYMGSWDLNDNDPDPMPNAAKASNHHGTRCAGEISAVANNSICGVGVAYGAQVSGIRLLDGPMTDSLEAEAFNKKFDINAVYSCSWGPDDDGKTVDGPHILAAKAMKYGVDFGRHGYGSIFVVASGNGGSKKDNCNYDGYANSIYTVTIGAVDESGAMPYYAEECASMLGVTFSSGTASNRDIVTTDWLQKGGTGCTEQHTGTSAAAPLVAGMIALMLQARPCLTWRDVQYIIIVTSVKVDVDLAHWQTNGAGLEHSHKHGFGLIKAWRLINAARVWRPVPWMTSYSKENAASTDIPRGPNASLVSTVEVTANDIAGYSLFVLEYVQVTLSLTHPFRGKLAVSLQCPSGTQSIIGAPRPHDNSTEGFSDWTFTTVRCWGEQPTGIWKLLISDEVPLISSLPLGQLVKWRITLFGTPMSPEDFQERRREVEDAMSGRYLASNFTPKCDPPPVTAPPYIPLSEKTLKILCLASAFCLVFAIYETFEYMFCYNEEKRQHSQECSRNCASLNRAAALASSTSESAQLLTQEETSPDSGQRNGSTQYAGDINNPHLPDDGIAAGLQQIRNQPPRERSSSEQGESIPLSTFSRTFGGRGIRNGHRVMHSKGGYYERVPTTELEDEDEDLVLFRTEGGGDAQMARNGAASLISGQKPSFVKDHQSQVKNSILPQLWNALAQDKNASDREQSRENRFSSLAADFTQQVAQTHPSPSSGSEPVSLWVGGQAEAASQDH